MSKRVVWTPRIVWHPDHRPVCGHCGQRMFSHHLGGWTCTCYSAPKPVYNRDLSLVEGTRS